MTFNPNPINVTAQAGVATAFTVSATPLVPSEFTGVTTLYGFISDSNNIISTTLNITQTAPTTYTATLYTSPSIAAGTYTGTMQLTLCEDPNCVNMYPGSPWTDPYTITITQAAGAGSSGTILTVAGNASAGYSGDGSFATIAQLNQPRNMIFDNSGNYYITDFTNNRIREVATADTISTIVGNGTAGYGGDGQGANTASINGPWGVVMDGTGNLYFADSANNRIRKVSSINGTISTIAGTGAAGFSGDGAAATAAVLNDPTCLAMDHAGNLYVCDTANNRIRKITPGGTISTVAGNGTEGYSSDGIAATNSALNDPEGLVFDSNNNMYISDYGNNRIREVTSSTGTISTVAGTGAAGYSGDNGVALNAKLNSPRGITIDTSNNLYFADSINNVVRKITAGGIISTIAGTGKAGFSGDNGPATLAQLTLPSGVAFDASGNLYVVDTGNSVIRRILK
jgi:sugar lactone lactonase YvrE